MFVEKDTGSTEQPDGASVLIVSTHRSISNCFTTCSLGGYIVPFNRQDIIHLFFVF